MDKAKEYGVISVPTVAVNGKLLDCSTRGKPTADDLKGGGQRNAAVNYFEALRCPPLQQ